MSAMATFTCLGIMNVSAGKQVIRSERYGDGYAYGDDQCVSTSESLIGSDGRALFSSTVSHNGNGDQLTDRTYFFYDDKLTTALNQQLKQRNMSSGSEGEVLEFYFDNKSRNFTYYDDNGRAIRSYGQNWRATSAGGEWNKNNTEGWEYDYNAAGRTVGHLHPTLRQRRKSEADGARGGVCHISPQGRPDLGERTAHQNGPDEV